MGLLKRVCFFSLLFVLLVDLTSFSFSCNSIFDGETVSIDESVVVVCILAARDGRICIHNDLSKEIREEEEKTEEKN